MVNVSATLSITVENLGTNPSGVVDVNVVLLHDEYTYFEISTLLSAWHRLQEVQKIQ